jgi:hypothetical protein
LAVVVVAAANGMTTANIAAEAIANAARVDNRNRQHVAVCSVWQKFVEPCIWQRRPARR